MTDLEQTIDASKGRNVLDRVIDAISGVVAPPKTAADFAKLVPVGHRFIPAPYPGPCAVRKLREASPAPWFTKAQVAKLRELETGWRNLEKTVNEHCDEQAKSKAGKMAAANVTRAERGESLKGALTTDEFKARFTEQRRQLRARQAELANAARAILETALPALHEAAERVALEVEAQHQACFLPWGLSAPSCASVDMLKCAAPKLAVNLLPTNVNAFPSLDGWLD